MNQDSVDSWNFSDILGAEFFPNELLEVRQHCHGVLILLVLPGVVAHVALEDRSNVAQAGIDANMARHSLTCSCEIHWSLNYQVEFWNDSVGVWFCQVGRKRVGERETDRDRDRQKERDRERERR